MVQHQLRMKKQYINGIVRLMKESDDVDLLDFIYQLLQKSASRAR